MALLRTVTTPDNAPMAAGLNVASNVADCPGARIKPSDIPLAEKCAPEILIFVTVTLEFPAFVNMTLNALLFPIATFPKLKLEVFALSNAEAAIPIPDKVTIFGELERSLTTETWPDRAPACFGENTRLKLDWLPGPISRGSEIPEIVIPAVVVLACVTVRFDPPLFDMVTDCEAVPPTGTEPKSMEAGDTEIVAAAPVACWFKEVLEPTVIPVQPENDRNMKRIKIRAAKEVGF